MLGLKTQESKKFESFFNLVQNEAAKKNAVFFLDAGDGNEFETKEFEGENLQGWLIPLNQVNKFEPIWQQDDVEDGWTDFFCWVECTVSNDNIIIEFNE